MKKSWDINRSLKNKVVKEDFTEKGHSSKELKWEESKSCGFMEKEIQARKNNTFKGPGVSICL